MNAGDLQTSLVIKVFSGTNKATDGKPLVAQMASKSPLEDIKGLKMLSKQSTNSENNITVSMQTTDKCICNRSPLSDEEIAKCWHNTPWHEDLKTRVFAFTRAVEAAHGIKEEK